ncbi:MAG: hypothetical protein IT204_03550 [Fimbriimonadaceae bacterium]|nr:hypothetical protein [Fimbriimonadaceae bacterium]
MSTWRSAATCCLLALRAALGAAEPIDLEPAKWQLQTQDAADGSGEVTADQFTLRRGAKGAGPYMLRVFRDQAVTPGTQYLFSFEVRVEGPGQAFGLVFEGPAEGQWDEANAKHLPLQRAADWATVRAVVVAGAATQRLRLDLRAAGANTTVTWRKVALVALGAAPPVLTPSTAAAALDGRLDDPLWREAVKLAPFRPLGDPTATAAPLTAAWAALRGGDLWLAYRASEPEMGSLRATPAGQQPGLAIWAEDCAETFLSTNRAAYAHVLVNAAGASHWEQYGSSQAAAHWYPSQHIGFHGDWQAAAARGEQEWTCELRIALADVFERPVGGDETLYLNVTRHRPRGAVENATWAPLTGDRYAVPSEFLPLTLRLPPRPATVAAPRRPGRLTETVAVPDLLLAGVPVKLTSAATPLPLPGRLALAGTAPTLPAAILAKLDRTLRRPGGPIWRLETAVGEPGDPALSPSERQALRSPEGFRLTLTAAGPQIVGRTPAGVLRGVATLLLLAQRARCAHGTLPTLTLYDAPRLPWRGVMGKLTRELIDLAYLLRLNKLLAYLDSFGGPTVFPFESYPIGGSTTTKAELRELFDYARAHGIEPIPYFASWGRTQYLKNMPDGAKLLVDDLDVLQPGYRNLDVADSQTHEVMLRLQEEILEALHPQSFCVALDEVHFGNIVTSAAAQAKGWKPSDWFVTAVTRSHELFTRHGVKLWLWGDMIDPGQNGKHFDLCGPDLLAKLPRDIGIFDWKYDGKEEPTVDYPSIAMFRAAGLETIGCPWYAPRSVPRLARSIAEHGGQGLLLTAWNDSTVPHLPAEWLRALALTAWFGWSPELPDLARLPLLPDTLVQAAAYWPGRDLPAGPTRALPAPAPATLVDGEALGEALGVPRGLTLDFLTAAPRTYRGASVTGWRRDGQPAAVLLAGVARPGLQNGNFARGLEAWQSQGLDAGCTATVRDGVLEVQRIAGTQFARVWQDLLLDPQRRYLLRYRVRVSGPGLGKVWTYSGDAKYTWDTARSLFADHRSGEWQTGSLALPAGYAALRICCAADGPGTTAQFDDVALLLADGQPEPTVAPVHLPVGGTVQALTFWHCTTPLPLLAGDMHRNSTEFGNLAPGTYQVEYVDGSLVDLPLRYRHNIVAPNDTHLGRHSDLGLAGSLDGRQWLNLPTWTWINPHPERPVAAVTLLPGSRPEVSVVWLGLAVE